MRYVRLTSRVTADGVGDAHTLAGITGAMAAMDARYEAAAGTATGWPTCFGTLRPPTRGDYATWRVPADQVEEAYSAWESGWEQGQEDADTALALRSAAVAENDLILAPDEPQADIRVRRDGDRDLSFSGWRLGEGSLGSGGSSGYPGDWTRGTDVTIYLTIGGSLLAHVHQWSRYQGESDIHRVLGPVANPADLLWLLIEDAGGDLGRASKEAWEEACHTYPPLAEMETERID